VQISFQPLRMLINTPGLKKVGCCCSRFREGRGQHEAGVLKRGLAQQAPRRMAQGSRGGPGAGPPALEMIASIVGENSLLIATVIEEPRILNARFGSPVPTSNGRAQHPENRRD
jgi:hypothetical protein